MQLLPCDGTMDEIVGFKVDPLQGFGNGCGGFIPKVASINVEQFKESFTITE